MEHQLSVRCGGLFAGEILSLRIFKYYIIFLSLSDNSFIFPSALLLYLPNYSSLPSFSPSIFIPCSLPCPIPASFSIFPCNLALHTRLFQSQFVSQNGRDGLSPREELCPVEQFWSDKQPAADWTGRGWRCSLLDETAAGAEPPDTGQGAVAALVVGNV